MERGEIEATIESDEAALETIVNLLTRAVPLELWPNTLRDTFALPVADPRVSATERWKLVAVCRHLFRAPTAPTALSPSPSAPVHVRRQAEHLRAGLAARVPFRAGLYLLP